MIQDDYQVQHSDYQANLAAAEDAVAVFERDPTPANFLVAWRVMSEKLVGFSTRETRELAIRMAKRRKDADMTGVRGEVEPYVRRVGNMFAVLDVDARLDDVRRRIDGINADTSVEEFATICEMWRDSLSGDATFEERLLLRALSGLTSPTSPLRLTSDRVSTAHKPQFTASITRAAGALSAFRIRNGTLGNRSKQPDNRGFDPIAFDEEHFT